MTYDHDMTTQHILDAMNESIAEQRRREQMETAYEMLQREQMELEREMRMQEMEVQRIQMEQRMEFERRTYMAEMEQAVFSRDDIEQIKKMIAESQHKRRHPDTFDDDDELFKI